MDIDGSLEILVVDDSEESRVLVRAFLKASGHRLIQAENGLEGLRLLKERRFDLALVDIEMPELDGRELVTKFREWEVERGLERTYLVALTAHQEFHFEGFDKSLSKPMKKAELLNVVSSVRLGRG
jgi:CheY-like chemotaxis protein